MTLVSLRVLEPDLLRNSFRTGTLVLVQLVLGGCVVLSDILK